MIDKEIIAQLVKEGLRDTDNYLVDITVKPGNLIVVEIDNDASVSIDDCAALSRFIENGLDREKEDFELEVGSAGITSPLRVLRQYKKYIGKEVEILTKEGKKLSGVLKSADEQKFVITLSKQVKLEGAKRKTMIEEDQSYQYDEIKYTKYLIRFK